MYKIIALAIASFAIGAFITNEHWEGKWKDRDIADLTAAKGRLESNAATEQKWADKFADISSWYQNSLDKNRNEADKTIADYHNGNIRLRKQLTCAVEGLSGSAEPRQVGVDARKCGLQERDVEFLVRYAERAQAVNIKLEKAQKLLRVIYGLE